MQNKRVLSVTELNTYLKNLLESDPRLNNIWVRGEISNFKAHSSGHLYFALKDRGGTIRCVMFRSRAAALLFTPENGTEVIIRGYLSVYERDGQYQLYAEEIFPAGQGALFLAFEQQKAKLAEEGLFDQARKKPLPLLPGKIGVVTSKDGAAWQDIQKVIFHRFPGAHLVLAPAAVQGEKAPGEIAKSLERLNRVPGIEVIIVGRGGGSIEELWAFNTEIVARAIDASRIPVISAVGHQTDVTIADFVADKRAATPSAAAEMAVPVREDLDKILTVHLKRMEKIIGSKLAMAQQRVAFAENAGPFRHPERLFSQRSQRVDTLYQSLGDAANIGITGLANRLAVLAGKAEMLSPLTTLARGYSICRMPGTKKVIIGADEVAAGDSVEVILKRGRLNCQVVQEWEGES